MNACEMQFKCSAVGRWKRCEFYEVTELASGLDCLYLSQGEFCSCASAMQKELKENQKMESNDQPYKLKGETK